MRLPPRRPSSAVTTSFESQSVMRPASASAEKPPNTTEWMAPMRAQASMATAASGIMGRYSVMRSPFTTPSAVSALARRQTMPCSSR